MSLAEPTICDETEQVVQLSVPGMHCAGCMGKIEKSLNAIEAVSSARVNLSARRVKIKWQNTTLTTAALINRLADSGFVAEIIDEDEGIEDGQDAAGHHLLRCLAVAGFATANVMLLSISVWSGAEETTRNLFHWISALIALPAILYAGQPFFKSAWAALSHRAMNMDVPISLSVILAGTMSLFETINGREQVYFDAAVTLLFFLLAGRYLDHMMRARARNAAMQLLKLSPKTALVETHDGQRHSVPVRELEIGMRVVVLPGGVIPVDGRILEGAAEIDTSIITGESLPELVGKGDLVYSGAVNLNAPLIMTVGAIGEDSFLSNVIQLMEVAEHHKSRYVRMADRLATYYAPLFTLSLWPLFWAGYG